VCCELGGQGERDDDEGVADVEFPGVRRGPDWVGAGERDEILPAKLRGGDERGVGVGDAEGLRAGGGIGEVREVY
jgi:hypothetical protein